MNIFRFGRGDFWGIVIPGAFLLINILMLNVEYFTNLSTQLFKTDLTNTATQSSNFVSVIFIPGFIVVSYLLGFFLRSISPAVVEKLSYITAIIPWNIWLAVIARIKDKGSKKSIKDRFVFQITGKRERFPYIEWFYSTYLPKTPNSYFKYYQELLDDEFDGNKERMKGQFFVNQSKILVFKSSATLREDIIFSEGFSRFLSGFIISLLICILLISFRNHNAVGLLFGYVPLYFVFCYKVRDIRMKEAVTIFDSRAFIS